MGKNLAPVIAWCLSVEMTDGKSADTWWKVVAVCYDVESAGIVERALEAAGQRVRVAEQRASLAGAEPWRGRTL